MFEIMETPDKRENDRKEYRIVRLQNGIKALLISDWSPKIEDTIPHSSKRRKIKDDGGPTVKLAACSLCVDVGGFSNPDNFQGLAHFLEHMIGQGSKKYPKENEFRNYLRCSSGSFNALTLCEETVFHLKVSVKYLSGALDRFANSFKEPLMSHDSMIRERLVVDLEFQSSKYNIMARRDQVLSSLGKMGHPSRKFTKGNMKTLCGVVSDVELHLRVQKFREHHYSAHRMFVCIQADLPLDDIQNLLLQHFSDIPNNKKPGIDFSQLGTHLSAFQDKFTEKVFVVKANQNKLDITFCLEPILQDYKTKAHDFISYLINHRGKGSLSSHLRNKNWILSLTAGVVASNGFRSNSMFCLFTISITLTKIGIKHVKEILDAVFGFIKFISTLDSTATKRVYAQLQADKANEFRFQQEESSLDNVKALVFNLKHYPSKDVLTGPSLMFVYDYEVIRSFVDKLNKTKVNIMITTYTPFEGHEFDQTEQWYGTQYCSYDIPKDWLEKLKNPTIFHEATLPMLDSQGPKDFTIVYDSETMEVPKYPKKIMENETCELWYRMDDKFLLPSACYYFYFKTSLQMLREIGDDVMMSVYSLLLGHKFDEVCLGLCPAIGDSLSYNTFAADGGLVLEMRGLGENIHRFVDTYIETLTTFADKVTEEEFKFYVVRQSQIYLNNLLSPRTFAKNLRVSIHVNNIHPTYRKLEALKNRTLEEFKTFAATFLTRLRIEALCQGNLTSEAARNIMENVLSRLKTQPIEELSTLKRRICMLPIGVYYFRCDSACPFDTMTCNFYPIGPISSKTYNLIDLLMMICGQPLFDILRSKEQLAYEVSCRMINDYGILGYAIEIKSQENQFTAEYIDERIEAFRLKLLKIIKKLSDRQFERFKESIVTIRLKDDNKLIQEMNRNWIEIRTGEYAFDRLSEQVECLKNITKSEFVEFYEKHLHVDITKLSIQVIGESLPASFSDTKYELTIIPLSKSRKGHEIANIYDFKRNLCLHPVTKTNF